jgi:phage repressor protein C with HTH and peptisase S24 domain
MKDKKTTGRVSDLARILEDCEVMEVTAMTWAPYYAKGDMLFVHPESKVAIRDRVSLTTRNGRHILGACIEKGNKGTVIQSFDGIQKFEHFDESDIASLSKIIAAVYQ